MTFKHNGQKYRITLNVALVASVQKEGAAEVHDRVCATDAAVCHYSDKFNPKTGAKLAITRALKRAFRDKTDREVIWSQIHGKVEEKGVQVFDKASFESAEVT